MGILLYPAAYCIIVLPITIARWSLFSHHQVSSAATFFGISMFYLSGATNVLLFLITSPEILLFPRHGIQVEELAGPEIELAEPEVEHAPPLENTHRLSAILSDPAKFQHSPEMTPSALGDEGSKESAVPSHASSSRISDNI